MFVPRSVDRLRPNKDRQTCQASPRRLNTRASRSAPSSVAHPLGRVAPARLPRRCTELPLRRPAVGQNSICTLDVGRQGGEAGRQCTSYSLCWALCALRWEPARNSFLRTWRYDSNSLCSVAARSALGLAPSIDSSGYGSRSGGRWRETLNVVRPETVIRWHRQGFRAFWNWKSRRGRIGRPPVDCEVAKLVRTMALANPLWGAPRIHGELLKLGLNISQRTVGRLMPRRAKPPSQTWRTFLQNHVADLVSVDFFVVPTATFRILYVFVVLLHHRWRVVHFNVTDSPTAAWTAQQIVEAFPDDSAPRYLLRDRDSIYGGEFRRRMKGMCIAEVLSSPRSPWQNPFAERVIGTLRRELLDHVIVLSEAQAVGSSSGSVRLPIAGSSTHPSAQAGGGVPQNPSLL